MEEEEEEEEEEDDDDEEEDDDEDDDDEEEVETHERSDDIYSFYCEIWRLVFQSELKTGNWADRPELTMYLGASFITSIRGMSEPTTPSRIPWDSWRDRQKRQNKAPKYYFITYSTV